MSIDKNNKYTDYLSANDNYEELTGDYLKKQNYSLDNCYDLEFQNRDELLSDEMGYYYESGAFKNKKAKNLHRKQNTKEDKIKNRVVKTTLFFLFQ